MFTIFPDIIYKCFYVKTQNCTLKKCRYKRNNTLINDVHLIKNLLTLKILPIAQSPNRPPANHLIIHQRRQIAAVPRVKLARATPPRRLNPTVLKHRVKIPGLDRLRLPVKRSGLSRPILQRRKQVFGQRIHSVMPRQKYLGL